MSDERREGRGVRGVLAATLTVALVIFADGFLSLILDRDVVEDNGTNLLAGPLMVVLVVAIVTWFVVREKPRSIGLRAIAAGLSAMILPPLGGSILQSFAQGQFALVPVFVGNAVASPFVISAAVIALIVVAGFGLLARAWPARSI